MHRLVVHRRIAAIQVAAILFFCAYCPAAVLRVPSQYGTIQQALNALQSLDTVLVDSGLYAEALHAPVLTFSLLGSAAPDVESAYPVIDPAVLPGSDSLACLVIPAGCSLTIERVVFRNGRAMYPRAPGGRHPGGIWNFSALPVVLTACIFDSVHGGIDYGERDTPNHVEAHRCRFVDVTGPCIYSRGLLSVTNSEIIGQTYSGFAATDDVLIEQCRFTGAVDLGWIGAYGQTRNIIRGCTLGPGIVGAVPVAVRSWAESRIAGNTLRGIGLSGPVMDLMYSAGEPIAVDSNTFTENYIYQYANPPAVWVDVDETMAEDTSFVARFQANVFADFHVPSGGGPIPKAIQFAGRCEVHRGQFVRTTPAENPVIRADSQASLQKIRECIFLDNGNAMHADNPTADARYNYWGHTSGPYHTILNPDGLGDAVGDFVDFIPWYPDTSFLAVPEPPRPLPEWFALTAYPNPFNAAVRLRLDVAAAGIYEIILFDLLGRRIAKIWQGPAVGFAETVFDGRALPAGIYFAQAREIPGGRPVATTKLVLLK